MLIDVLILDCLYVGGDIGLYSRSLRNSFPGFLYPSPFVVTCSTSIRCTLIFCSRRFILTLLVLTCLDLKASKRPLKHFRPQPERSLSSSPQPPPFRMPNRAFSTSSSSLRIATRPKCCRMHKCTPNTPDALARPKSRWTTSSWRCRHALDGSLEAACPRRCVTNTVVHDPAHARF